LKVALDTNILVELLSTRSGRHARTRFAYEELQRSGAEFVIADHVLLEAFAVLSHSPRPVGIPPRQTEQLLRDHFGNAIIAPIRPGLAWDAIGQTLTRGFSGGRVYDTLIALATFAAGAEVLLTWNTRHFYGIAPAGLEIREP
jgi:predicted nucleic acid-binding protein